jgi:hypothetical protein
MEYTFGNGYGDGYVHEHVYVHDARLVQLFLIGDLLSSYFFTKRAVITERERVS